MNYYNNQEQIFESTFDVNKLTFIYGKKLNDSINDINLEGNEEIYYKEELENEAVYLKFEKLVNKKNGRLHFENGTSFVIQEGLIKQVVISKESLGNLKLLDSIEVIKRIGPANKVEQDIIMYVFDPVNEGDIFHYDTRNISIQFHPDTGKIKELRVNSMNKIG